MKKFTIITLILFLTFNGIFAATTKPHIIFILADDMGFADLGFLGSAIQTPNLDKLRKEGMYLSRCYSQPQCTPSRVALMTGNYPYRYGMHEHIVTPYMLNGVPGSVKTIAEKMKEANYKTSIIGKWHIGEHKSSYLPHNQGFDHSFVTVTGSMSYWNYEHYGFPAMCKNGKKLYPINKEGGEESGNTHATELFTTEAVDVIGNHNTKEPLFMFLSYTAPHHPLHVQKRIQKNYKDVKTDAHWSKWKPTPDREEVNENQRRLYMGLVHGLDEAIGKVYKKLAEKGMLDNTLIVFYSDNGGIVEADNRPFRGIKGSSLEGGIRVPGIAWWPSKIKANSTSGQMVYIGDWYPTFAEIAGLSTTKDSIDGISAVNVLLGQNGKREYLPLISSERHSLVLGDYSLHGKGQDYNELIQTNLSDFKLYNVNKDPYQSYPINDDVKIRVMKNELKGHLRKTHRGFFNWDEQYSKGRIKKYSGNHHLDWVKDDLLEVKNTASGPRISPVFKALKYELLGQKGEEWKSIETYIPMKDQASYVFNKEKTRKYSNFKVVSDDRYELPAFDYFETYDDKIMFSTAKDRNEYKYPKRDGFLNLCNVKNGTSIKIVSKNNKNKVLQLEKTDKSKETSLTRYCIEPFNKGKVYVSMLIKTELIGDAIAGINFIRQCGRKHYTEGVVQRNMLSIQFKEDKAYVIQTDQNRINHLIGKDKLVDSPLLRHKKGAINHFVFCFDLGTTGQDEVSVFLNPKNKKVLKSAPVFKGEFTFDKIEWSVTGQEQGVLELDELMVTQRLEDLFP